MGVSPQTINSYMVGRRTIGPAIRERMRELSKPIQLQTAGFETPTFAHIPLLGANSKAGYPDDDYSQDPNIIIDVSKEYNSNTFYVIVRGNSMIGAGIQDGDFLLVDKNRTYYNGSIVIARKNGILMVKRLKRNGKEWLLNPENPEHNPIAIDSSVQIVGVVIKSERRYI